MKLVYVLSVLLFMTGCFGKGDAIGSDIAVEKNTQRDLMEEDLNKAPVINSSDDNVKLKFSSMESLTSIKQIGGLYTNEEKAKVSVLTFNGCSIEDLNNLNQFSNLKQIRIENNKSIKELTVYGSQTLVKLSIKNAQNSKILIKGELPELNVLILDKTKISNFPDISSLPKLEKMELKNSALKEVISRVNNVSLKRLDINNNIDLTNIEGLAGLTNLETLNASSTKINAFYGIKELNKIKWIMFDNTEIDSLDFISNSTITNISAANCRLESIPNSNNFKSLRKLVVNDNKITTMSFLESLPNLITFYIDNNNITVFEGISNTQVTDLKAVGYNNNPFIKAKLIDVEYIKSRGWYNEYDSVKKGIDDGTIEIIE